ncbi:MAG: RimK family alpha-L-glutamate ligase [Candidatus Bathyarchaeia archaeon]
MRIGILTRNPQAWCNLQLKQAMVKLNVVPVCFGFKDLMGTIGLKLSVTLHGKPIEDEVSAIIVRPIGSGSLEQIILRVDLLKAIEELGVKVVNRGEAIEKAVDKYYSLLLLERNGVPTPTTIVTEGYGEALRGYRMLGGSTVLKPLFGSRGVGVARVEVNDVAVRLFKLLSSQRSVIYLQSYIPHGFSDIRAFVVGNRVIASARRISGYWKTNVAQGAWTKPVKLDSELEEIAVKSASILGCEVAGVDIMVTRDGSFFVNEVNSQPDWRGLQSATDTNIAEEIVGYIASKLKG